MGRFSLFNESLGGQLLLSGAVWTTMISKMVVRRLSESSVIAAIDCYLDTVVYIVSLGVVVTIAMDLPGFTYEICRC
jgi:hypothetical protein